MLTRRLRVLQPATHPACPNRVYFYASPPPAYSLCSLIYSLGTIMATVAKAGIKAGTPEGDKIISE